MSKDIWVYAETHDGKLCDIVPELLTKGRQLKAHNGGDLVAVVLGSSDDAALRELSEYGADMVIIGENAALSSYSARTYAQAMTALAKKYEPEIFIIPATGVGREVAPLTILFNLIRYFKWNYTVLVIIIGCCFVRIVFKIVHFIIHYRICRNEIRCRFYIISDNCKNMCSACFYKSVVSRFSIARRICNGFLHCFIKTVCDSCRIAITT